LLFYLEKIESRSCCILVKMKKLMDVLWGASEGARDKRESHYKGVLGSIVTESLFLTKYFRDTLRRRIIRIGFSLQFELSFPYFRQHRIDESSIVLRPIK